MLSSMTLLSLGNADASIAFLSLNRKVKFRLFANNGCYRQSDSIGPYLIGLSGQAHLLATALLLVPEASLGILHAYQLTIVRPG